MQLLQCCNNCRSGNITEGQYLQKGRGPLKGRARQPGRASVLCYCIVLLYYCIIVLLATWQTCNAAAVSVRLTAGQKRENAGMERMFCCVLCCFASIVSKRAGSRSAVGHSGHSGHLPTTPQHLNTTMCIIRSCLFHTAAASTANVYSNSFSHRWQNLSVASCRICASDK